MAGRRSQFALVPAALACLLLGTGTAVAQSNSAPAASSESASATGNTSGSKASDDHGAGKAAQNDQTRDQRSAGAATEKSAKSSPKKSAKLGKSTAAPSASARTSPAPRKGSTLTVPTYAEMPATAPRVAYSGGQLTIEAQNSTMSDILRAVHAQTGATVDMPLASGERVVGSFGPGPARDVLALLLEGSHFNYVLLGSPRNPNVLDKVVLIAKTGPDDVAAPPESKDEPGAKPDSQMAAQPEEDMAVEEGPAEVSPAEAQPDSAEADQQVPAVEGQQPPAIKTPEQLLQELQRQQQIMQQSQPGMRPGPPQPPQQ